MSHKITLYDFVSYFLAKTIATYTLTIGVECIDSTVNGLLAADCRKLYADQMANSMEAPIIAQRLAQICLQNLAWKAPGVTFKTAVYNGTASDTVSICNLNPLYVW